MRKILKIKEPISNSYHFMAFPLSILEQHAITYEWIYSNFIQTCLDTNYDDSPVPFYFYIYDYTLSPFLEVQKIDRNFMNFNRLDIIELVKNAIDNEYYIYLNLDDFYVPDRRSFKNKHFSHDSLVYGYDTKKEEIYLYGFDSKMKLNTTVISFSNFILAYDGMDIIDTDLTYINLYKFNKLGKYKLDLNLILEQLIEYSESKNSSVRFSTLREPWIRSYGMNFYENISCYLQNFDDKNIRADIRIFHFMYEHKNIMANRIKFLLNKSMIKDTSLLISWEKITKDALIIRNNVIKMNLSNKKVRYADLSVYFELLKKDEENALKKTIQHLKECLTES